MKYKPGQLIEIIGTVDTAPDGTVVQSLSLEYIGRLALVVSYNSRNLFYHVLVGNDQETLEVYEEEIRLVNG